MSLPRSKVAVITGANAGLGFNLAQRLLTSHSNIRLCLACRNKMKAEEAASSLATINPQADISIVILDTSSIKSVCDAAQQMREKYDHIDYLYLNAGVMNVKGVDWSYFWQGLFSSRVFYMFTTGEGLLLHEDGVSEDGLQNVFETNVFGHYALVKKLEDRLGNVSGKTDDPSQLIWTSSSAASKKMFSIEDFQHKNGRDPYSSSKYCIDVLSIGLNNKLSEKNVFSHSVCPGLVMTNMTYGIMPQWFWTVVLPLIWLLRIFVPSMTNTTSNGTEALVWLSHQEPSSLDPQTKFLSVVSPLGTPYVKQEKMKIDHDMAETLIKELDILDHNLRKKPA